MRARTMQRQDCAEKTSSVLRFRSNRALCLRDAARLELVPSTGRHVEVLTASVCSWPEIMSGGVRRGARSSKNGKTAFSG
jgi:hypothetical protein